MKKTEKTMKKKYASPTPLFQRRHALLTTASLAVAGMFFFSALGAAGCKEPDPAAQASPSTAATSPLRVTCTIGMIADVVRTIGGEQVRVTALMGPHIDPHLYKPTPADHRALSESDVVFYNGLHLEGRMSDLFVQMARKKPVIAVTQHIKPELLREPPEFEGNYDPHVWFDVSLWMAAVEAIRDSLIEHLPKHRESIQKRARTYLDQLSSLHSECKTKLSVIPKPQRVLVTAHDAFGYFGRAYDLEVLAIQGISTESEAGIKKMNDLVNMLVQRKIRAVFVESTVNPRSIEALVQGCAGRGHPIKVGGQLFSDAMGAEGTPEGTYLGMVRANVDVIVKALQ
jgi:manganese/zinc/iron transport system substrate-binding protein